MHRKGFTLIELLVVIAIIAILAAILFPVFAQARERARVATCASNVRQIAMAVRMYVQDNDETFPIFYAYNSRPPAGQPGHKGVEVELMPYVKSSAIFRCPSDTGGPYVPADVPGADSYWAAYGSSYRFVHGCFTTIAGESTQNNIPYTFTEIIRDSDFVVPAETRLMRDEMLSWFGTNEIYGYLPDYFRQWHSQGGGFVFADGHAKFVSSSGDFDRMAVHPRGYRSGDIDPVTNSLYYWLYD
ncbi:MAG: prepilin-type N-terminal cleavage/methylation domain-containing protein [Armatimonadetes bacterium]|nr:prepilin-type N-terminal cleavage/methylation domain-containing protein [Armatimonadota bacterium]